MGQWARDAAEKFKAEEATRSIEAERFVSEDRLRRSLAPKLWQELRLWLKQECQDYNFETGKEALVFEVWPDTQAAVRRKDKPAGLNVEFDPEAQGIRYSCGAGRGEFLFRVNPDTTVVLENPYHTPYTVEEAGNLLLNLLMKSPFSKSPWARRKSQSNIKN